MNDWVVETPSFEEDLMNNRVVMLNQVGVNRVVEIIKEKDKEIERLNNIIDELEKWLEDKDKNALQDDNYWEVLDKLKELRKIYE